MRRIVFWTAACVSAAISCQFSIALAQGRGETNSAAGQVVTGGTLDPSVTSVEMYGMMPTPAAVPPGCQVAAQYVQFINNGQFDRIADLYADDAIVFSPASGLKAKGRAQIADFYVNRISKSKPNIIPVAYGTGPNQCFQIHAVRRTVDGRDGFVLSTVDHFTFDRNGKIKRMIAYRRP